MNRYIALCHQLEAARTVQWLLLVAFFQAEDGSAEVAALLRASTAQELRVSRLELLV